MAGKSVSAKPRTKYSDDDGELLNKDITGTGFLYENVTIPRRESDKEAGTPSKTVSAKESATQSMATPSTNSPEYAPGGIPEKDPGVESRGEFSNPIQYLLTCIGYAVGLGNIWRFPSVAYENGGGAFLIPYVLVSIFFGLPTLYIECALGQFTQFGPSRAFKFYMPLMQGIGWAMSLIALSIALYYNVIVSWSMVYLFYTVTDINAFSECGRYWNTPLNCSNTVKCADNERFFNGSCFSDQADSTLNSSLFNLTLAQASFDHAGFVSAPDEFFTYYITQKHLSFEFGNYNWKIAGCLVFCWILTALGLVFGVKWLGRISMVTATVPYLIIIVLLGRGVTLDGAMIGIEHYLTKPDFSKILDLEPWKAALTQICFSLSVGQGGLLAMSSYNRRSHKCFKDAVLVMVADSVMSVIGGLAVFSVLGFMAKNSGKSIDQVVPSALSLAFVAYPEAISHMPVPVLWSILFFFMIFMLGISTMFGLVEGFITCLCDSSEFLRARHALTVIATCTVCGSLGLFLFCFQNGFHFFNIFNEYIGSFSLAVVIVFEIVVIVVVYGPRSFFRDMEAQFGRPKSTLGRIVGPQGVVIKALMCITAPIFAVGVAGVTLYDLRSPKISDYIGLQAFHYPSWAIGFGLVLAAVPLSAIPIFALINCYSASKSGKGLRSVLRITDDHPAVRYNLEEPPSCKQFWATPTLDQLNTQIIPTESLKQTRRESDTQKESAKQ